MADTPAGVSGTAAQAPDETGTGETGTGETGTAPLTGDSRVELRPLSVRPEGDEFMVGDLARGEFITVPQIAVVVIDALRDGLTLAEAGNRARDSAGTDVDVADFVGTLCDLGFVASIDGVSLAADGPELTYGGKLGAVTARLARPLYSAPAWVAYGLLLAGTLVLLIGVAWFRPRYGQFFFLSSPVLSLALLTIIGIPLGMAHELAHWLGARVEGAPARITISRRYYLLVFQTDLSALWSLPRQRRFGALLAGIAFDAVVLAALLCVRGAQYLGWWHPQLTLARLLAALVLLQVISISFQFVVFLRTDLYAVLITGLGYLNLTRVSKLQMARRYRRLSESEERELDSADPRDKAAARWYGWVQIAGVVLIAYYFAAFFGPAAVQLVRWVVTGLTTAPATSLRFWVVLASGCVAALPIVIPPLTYIRDRQRRRGATQSG
jgi:putative peptide zinc metalloprotease protein